MRSIKQPVVYIEGGKETSFFQWDIIKQPITKLINIILIQ